MSIGTIIVGIGILYSFFQWISEQNKKDPAAKRQHVSQAMKQNVQRAAKKNKQHLEQMKQPKREVVSRTTADKLTAAEKIMADQHLSDRQKAQRLSMMQGDLTEDSQPALHFDRDNLVEGLIMAEILSPPKARR